MAAKGAEAVAEAVASRSVTERIESARGGTRRSRVHSTREMSAAHMRATEAASTTKTAAGSTESARMAAALCPDGHGQEESKRRDGQETAHQRDYKPVLGA